MDFTVLFAGGILIVSLSSLVIITLSIGLAYTNSRFSRLEKGQTKLENGQMNLEKGQMNLEKRMDKLENGQVNLEKRMDKLENGQVNLEKRMDNLDFKLDKILDKIQA